MYPQCIKALNTQEKPTNTQDSQQPKQPQKTTMKIEVEDVEEVIDKKVDSYSTSTRIIIPKKYANRRVKVLILKDGSPGKDKPGGKGQ